MIKTIIRLILFEPITGIGIHLQQNLFTEKLQSFEEFTISKNIYKFVKKICSLNLWNYLHSLYRSFSFRYN